MELVAASCDDSKCGCDANNCHKASTEGAAEARWIVAEAVAQNIDVAQGRASEVPEHLSGSGMRLMKCRFSKHEGSCRVGNDNLGCEMRPVPWNHFVDDGRQEMSGRVVKTAIRPFVFVRRIDLRFLST